MTDIAIYHASVPDRMRYAEALSGSSLLPPDYRGKPANVLLALEYGAALGIPPMTAIQQVHVIQGRPVASAQLIGALVRKAGHRLRVSGDDRRAVCEIVRGDDPDFTFRSEWTMERAAAAKLTGKDTWRQYPGNMLRARAITECARDACPEALAGVSYTAEELGDDTLPAEAYPQTSGAVSAEPSGDNGVRAPLEGAAGSSLPTAAPASEPDIDDAVVVAETPAPGCSGDGNAAAVAEGGGETTGAEGLPGEGQLSAPVHPDTEARFKRMQILLRERFGNDRPAVLAWVGQQVGRVVPSTKDLDAREVVHVVAVLEGRKPEARDLAPMDGATDGSAA